MEFSDIGISFLSWNGGGLVCGSKKTGKEKDKESERLHEAKRLGRNDEFANQNFLNFVALGTERDPLGL